MDGLPSETLRFSFWMIQIGLVLLFENFKFSVSPMGHRLWPIGYGNTNQILNWKGQTRVVFKYWKKLNLLSSNLNTKLAITTTLKKNLSRSCAKIWIAASSSMSRASGSRRRIPTRSQRGRSIPSPSVGTGKIMQNLQQLIIRKNHKFWWHWGLIPAFPCEQ